MSRETMEILLDLANIRWWMDHRGGGPAEARPDCRECGYWTAQGVKFCHRCGKDIIEPLNVY